MTSLFLRHFVPTWLIGAVLVYLLRRRTSSTTPPWLSAIAPSVIAALCFAPTTVGIGWFRLPVPIPSLIVTELTDVEGPSADELRGAAITFAIGFAVFWTAFTLLGARRAKGQPA